MNPTRTSAATGKRPAPPQAVDALLREEPDLVDRIFEYLVELLPEIRARQVQIKQSIRDEYGGEQVYVRRRGHCDQHPLADKVARLMANGRNKTQAARILGVSRQTVYRLLAK